MLTYVISASSLSSHGVLERSEFISVENLLFDNVEGVIKGGDHMSADGEKASAILEASGCKMESKSLRLQDFRNTTGLYNQVNK